MRSNGALLRANAGYSDIIHIPQHQVSNFARLAQFFLHYNVFLEIAIPTIVQCLEIDDNVIGLWGILFWESAHRQSPWHYLWSTIVVGHSFFHPAKWGFTAKGSKNYTSFFCKSLEYNYKQ